MCPTVQFSCMRSLDTAPLTSDRILPAYDDHPVCKNITSLEKQFSSIVSSTRQELTEKKTDAREIHNHILSLPYRLKKEVSYRVEEHAEEIQKRTNLTKLFVYLDRTLWNFMDYSLLEHLILLFGSSQLKRDMEGYVRKISAFEKSTTISQLIKYWPGRRDTPPNYCPLTAKIDVDPDQCTLESLNSLRKDFCKDFLPPLSEFALLHCNFEHGSVVVTWLLALDLVPALTKAVMCEEKAAFFDVHAVKSVHIRDIQVYPQSSPSGTDEIGEICLHQQLRAGQHVGALYPQLWVFTRLHY